MKFILVTILLFGFIFSSKQHKKHIALFISEDTSPQLIDSIENSIYKLYNKKVDLVGRIKLPQANDESFIITAQDCPTYDVDSLVNKLDSIPLSDHYSNRILLTSEDITTFNGFFDKSIYGYTDKRNKASVISSYLITQDDSAKTISRTVNVTLHELGHQFGLWHCEDTTCIMTPYDNLDDTKLCIEHERYLKYLLRRGYE